MYLVSSPTNWEVIRTNPEPLNLFYTTETDLAFNTGGGLYINSNSIITNTDNSGNNINVNFPDLSGQVYSNGRTTITNTTLRNLQYLANVSSDINTSISNLNTKTTNISYGSFNTTTFSGNLSFPLASINSTSISNSTFVALSGNQSVGGQKTFNSQLIMNNNIRLDTGSLILNTNTLTLTNANLQKIQYLSTVSSDIQTQINNITGVSLSANNVFTGSNSFNGTLNTTTFNSSVQINNGFGALYNNAVQFVFYPTQTTFSNGSAGENVFEFTANNTDRGITFQGGKGSDGRSLFGLYYLSGSFANPVNRLPILYGRDTGTQSTNVLTVASGTLATTNLTFSGTLNTISTTIFGYLSGLTENIKTSLDSLSSRASTLETKNTGISYSGTTTTIANTLASSTLTFSTTLNNISTTTFGYLSNLSGNIQDQLNSLSTRIATVEIVGTIIMSPLNDLQTTTSNKYLMCTGQLVSRTTYSALFAKFGELFSAGDGSTTFGLPNYNGMFLRGMGNQIINGVNYGNYNSTYAPDQDSIQNHTHSGQSGSFLGTVNITVAPSYNSGSGASPNAYTFSNTGQMATGRINDFETKPVSIGIYYYVRT
jgi:microcystin-dependent protein